MNKAFWAVFVVGVGLVSVAFIFFFQNATNTEEQNYALLQEVTEAAMYDAVDIASYKATGTIRIDAEKFVENFVRRFAESVSLGNTYVIDIYDINETPTKVTLKVSTKLNSNVTGELLEFDLTNRISAILETPY